MGGITMKQQYDSYKPSGIDWIGDIPKHWTIAPFKRSLRINNGCDYKHIVTDDGYPVIGSGGQFAYASDYLYDGEVLLLGRKGTIDRPMHFVGKFWTVDTMFYAIPNDNVCCKYMYYQALGFPYDYYSTATALPSMAASDLANNPIIVPPLAEQEAIAAWLDEKCQEIDAAIAKGDREIELIDELKQSEISRVVTRGLNPDAPLRPSGIDWIGDIPSHWKAMPLKREGTMSTGLTFTKADLVECGDAVVSYGQIHSSKNDKVNLTEDLVRYIPKSISNVSALVPQGSFIFADTSEDLEGCGNAAYNNSDRVLYAGYHTIILRRKNIGGKYLAYLFQTDTWRSQIRSRVSGVKVYSVTQAILATTSIILPPLSEQQEIADYLDKKCAEIDELKAKLTKKRETLTELRQSIISEVVTGKRKVI